MTFLKSIKVLSIGVIKYISRARLKNGDEDLRKARNYIDYLLEV